MEATVDRVDSGCKTDEAVLRKRVETLELENARLKMMLELKNKEIAHMWENYSQAEYYKELCQKYETSKSWRITRPLRLLTEALKKLLARIKAQ